MKAHQNKILGEGLTYDDVLLVPAYSEVLPRDVSISTKFTRNIQLNVPILSAAMDTVTESAMAMAMAREGGIGVLHKNMSIEAQAAAVRKVKRAESGMILDPVTLPKDATIGEDASIRCAAEMPVELQTAISPVQNLLEAVCLQSVAGLDRKA